MTPGNQPPDTQEIRYAVVMYGGVSLAIYMNGIAQEMLRLVRSTAADNPDNLSGTEKIYRELASLLHLGRRPGDTNLSDTPRTRFVIDVLAGTSAGGINAVFLAKALALKSKNLDDLRDLWMDKADLDTLLNDTKSEEGGRYPISMPKKSLLNSQRMYGLLRHAFGQMDQPNKLDTSGRESADRIDLYVTATDLNGLAIPIELTDKPLLERIHRTVFHFEYDPLENLNDFDSAHNTMLAFASRCTSSFPGAFEPMRFEDIRPKPTASEINDFRHFFDTYTEPRDNAKPPREELDFPKRVFADGGYLDNRPFGHVIDRISERTSNCAAFRKLVFVDPFPEHLDQRPLQPEFNFAENAVLAATLPRYETIRQDIARINEANRRTLRASEIEKALFRLDPTGARLVPDRMKLGQKYGEFYMDELLDINGPLFVTDQEMKVAHVSNWLALVVTRQLGFNETGDYYRVARLIVRAWRNATFARTRQEGVEKKRRSLTEFIRLYDFAFRLSRLRYFIHMMDRVSAYNNDEFDGFRDHLVKAELLSHHDFALFSRESFLAALTPARKRQTELLSALHRINRHIEARVRKPLDSAGTKALINRADALRAHFENKDLMQLLRLADTDEQQRYADELYREAASPIGDYFTALSDLIHINLGGVYGERKILEQDINPSTGPMASLAASWLIHLWDSYEIIGNLMARLLPNGQIGESGTVEIFRIGPDATDLTIRKASQKEHKLAGAKLGGFGAFLSEGWRENDVLWGRLDGAERLIVSLLPDPADKNLREQYIQRVRDEILKEEFHPAKGRIYRWFAGQVQSHCGSGLSENKIKACLGHLMNSEPLASVLSTLQSNPANWQPFIREYYELPSCPSRQKQAEWLARTVRIAGEMLEEIKLPKSIPGTVKLAGLVLLEFVLISLPGSLRNFWFSHILGLLMLAGVIFIVLGSVFTSDFTSVGFKLLLYAGGLRLTVWCMQSWLSYGSRWKKILVALGVLLVSGVLTLAAFGYRVVLNHLHEVWGVVMKWIS